MKRDSQPRSTIRETTAWRAAGRRLLIADDGQSVIMTALLMTVFFGMLALVIDLGQVFMQRRFQQNAVDAASMAAARKLAGSVAVDASGNAYYVDQTDATVMTRAQQLATNNWLGSASARTLTLQYLDCSKNVIRAAVAGASTAVPTNTCYVRATGVSTVNTLFLRAADPSRTSASTSATATARIAPTSPPAHTNGTWPITRWKNYPGRGTCAYVPDSTCVFWSNNGGSQDTSIGSWKEKVYLSKYSQFTCSGTAALQLLTPDPSRLGNPCASSSVKQLDMEGWLRNGFFGSLSDGKDGTPASRPEVDTSGVQGNNYADAMRDYIDANPESCSLGGVGGRCRVLQVILWEQAEKYVNGTWQPWPPSTSNPPDRIIISDIFCFKFYRNQINSSSVSGIYLSCYESTPPLSGPPSGVANTVQMVD